MLFILAFIITCEALGQEPLHTNDILRQAYQQAAREKKNVFVIFHASWCGWCHKMDSAMNEPEMKPLFNKNYVITHLTIKESKDKKHLENPGAEELLARYRGNDQGIPYWLIFDKNGRLLADSQMRPEGAGPAAPGKNTGCPASEEEVAHFVKVLSVTSSLNVEELDAVKKRFLQNQ